MLGLYIHGSADQFAEDGEAAAAAAVSEAAAADVAKDSNVYGGI